MVIESTGLTRFSSMESCGDDVPSVNELEGLPGVRAFLLIEQIPSSWC